MESTWIKYDKASTTNASKLQTTPRRVIQQVPYEKRMKCMRSAENSSSQSNASTKETTKKRKTIGKDARQNRTYALLTLALSTQLPSQNPASTDLTHTHPPPLPSPTHLPSFAEKRSTAQHGDSHSQPAYSSTARDPASRPAAGQCAATRPRPSS